VLQRPKKNSGTFYFYNEYVCSYHRIYNLLSTHQEDAGFSETRTGRSGSPRLPKMRCLDNYKENINYIRLSFRNYANFPEVKVQRITTHTAKTYGKLTPWQKPFLSGDLLEYGREKGVTKRFLLSVKLRLVEHFWPHTIQSLGSFYRKHLGI